jgi:hypothetical protein
MHAHIVAYKVHDDGGVYLSVASLVMPESLTAHAAGLVIRLFLGVEDGDYQVAPQRRAEDRYPSHGKRDGDGRSIVIGAGCCDGAVVMCADKQGCYPTTFFTKQALRPMAIPSILQEIS